MNEQKPLGTDRFDNGSLFVHSIFPTVQGEGPFAGRAAVFIRLYGCNLQCPGCDTDYTSQRRVWLPADLSAEVRSLYPAHRLIVITGGEPFRQNITPLVQMLVKSRRHVQVESNGVLYPGNDFPWYDEAVTVVVSPKTSKIHPSTWQYAHAFKYVLRADRVGTDGLPEMALSHPISKGMGVAKPRPGAPVYLQPEDEQDPALNYQNMQAVARVVQENPEKGYIMGVQMHKLLELP